MIDAHCHLQDPLLLPRLETVLAAAQAEGVDTFICAAGDLDDSRQAIALAQGYPGVWATAGVYPRDQAPPNLPQALTGLVGHPRVVAVGETGLDFALDTSPAEKARQKELLEIHLEVAASCRLPLVLHCRRAFADLYPVLREKRKVLRGVQLHCWTGDWEWARRFLDLDCYLSFGGMITFKSADTVRETATKTPQDRLLIETDSPWLSPEPLRGTVNQPKNAKIIAQALAHVRRTSVNQIVRVTDANARRLFSKMI